MHKDQVRYIQVHRVSSSKGVCEARRETAGTVRCSWILATNWIGLMPNAGFQPEYRIRRCLTCWRAISMLDVLADRVD